MNKNAIILIYPDGEIDKSIIKDRDIHLAYFRDISNISPRFNKLLEENNININDMKGNIKARFTNLNLILSELGIISFLNLRIKEIRRNKIYETARPRFLITLPNELSSEQKHKLISIFKENDCTKCSFGKYADYEPFDIEYTDVVDMLATKQK